MGCGGTRLAFYRGTSTPSLSLNTSRITGGTFAPERLATGGSAGQVLTWGTTPTWSSAGSGTITGIVTANASGLDGGATTGTATLAVNASNFAGYQNTTAAANDTMMIFNQADGETERITISQLGLTLSSGSVTDTGNQRSFVVPASGVTGTADDIILTTGLAANLSDGDEFYFTPSAVNTGAVTVNIDGNGADALVHYRDSGLRALNADELQNRPVIITYQASNDRFLWRSAAGSTASYYQVATGNGDLAVLGAQGVFDPDRLGISGMAGHVLSYVGTQAVWVAAGSGTGDITEVTTSATSGLQGGMTSGAVDLSLDLSGLAVANGQFITRDTDRLYIEDRDQSNPRRQISIFELQQALMINTDTNHQNPADQDRFFVNDVSFQGGTPRYIRWSDLRSRFVEASQMHVADSVAYDNVNTRINVTISILGSTGNIRDGSAFIFSIPTLTGSTAATEFVISVNGQTDYPWFTDNGTDRITAGELVEGDRVAVIRDGTDIYWMFGGGVGGGGGTDTGNQRTFKIPNANVTGTVNDIILTTGESITIQDGDQFWFRPSGTNNGDVTISVDGGTAFGYLKANGQGATAEIPSQDLRSGEPTVATYLAHTPNIFVRSAVAQGNAALYNIGAGARLIPVPNNAAPANSVVGFDGTNVSWVPSGGVVGARRYHIPDADVTGTGRAIVVSTGESLTALNDGDGISFRIQTTISGGSAAVTVAVDSVAAITIQQAAGDGLVSTFGSGQLRQNFMVDLIYSVDANRLMLVGTNLGSGARFNIGTGEGNIPQLVTGGLLELGRMPNLPTGQITSGAFPTARIADAAITNVKLADDSIAEVKLDMENDPMADYVIGWNGTTSQMTWRAEGTTPVQTHTRYFAVGIDRTFVEADYTGGTSFMTDTVQVPTFTVNNYWAIAVPAANPITSIIALTNPQQDLTALFTQESDLVIATENHNIWISNNVFFVVNPQPMLRIT